MTIRCRDCNAVSPNWSEFCIHCGHIFSDEERASSDSSAERCRICYSELIPGSGSCPSCGAPVAGKVSEHSLRTSMVAKLLALVPGVFNLFGLGHLYLGKYVKALILLVVSVALRLANDAWVVPGEIPHADVAWLVVSLSVFVYQLWDVYRIADHESFGH